MNVLKPKLYTSFQEAVTYPKQVRRLQLYYPHGDFRFQNMTQFENLEELHLGWFPDTELPSEIKAFSKLKTLVCLNMRFHTLPDWLFSCVTLQQLTIRGSDIKVVPKSIYQLSELHELGLGNNGLATVPAALGLLHKLRCLSLPDNCLSELPIELSQLSHLSSLELVNNAFSKPETDKFKTWFPSGVVKL